MCLISTLFCKVTFTSHLLICKFFLITATHPILISHLKINIFSLFTYKICQLYFLDLWLFCRAILQKDDSFPGQGLFDGTRPIHADVSPRDVVLLNIFYLSYLVTLWILDGRGTCDVTSGSSDGRIIEAHLHDLRPTYQCRELCSHHVTHIHPIRTGLTQVVSSSTTGVSKLFAKRDRFDYRLIILDVMTEATGRPV